METFVNLSYIAAAILFVFGIKMLGHADTARKGNQISSIGMALAIIVTLLSQGLDYKIVVGGYRRRLSDRLRCRQARANDWHARTGRPV